MKNILAGEGIERMPDWAFRAMKLMFAVHYFFKPAGRYIRSFGIKPGFTVVDYGCGTGAFLRDASNIAGPEGRVYAVDVHELAIQSVNQVIKRYDLKNVIPVLARGNTSTLPEKTADLVYAIDMFHMVSDSKEFLRELCRITKDGGTLVIEDGHQSRKKAREKISGSGFWEIISEEKRFMKCKPVKNA